MMEKLTFALVTASRKLRHYFQAHVINVLTNHPPKKAMNKLEVAGRLIQWAVELNEFDDRYQPRSMIKHKHWRISLQSSLPTKLSKTGWMKLRGGSSMWMARPHYMLEELELYSNPRKEISWNMQPIYNTKPPIMKQNMKLSLKNWNQLSPWGQSQQLTKGIHS